MILDKLQPASFKGFPFLTPDTSVQDGRKTVTHEFVGSDNRFIEDLGKFPIKFEVTAIVHGTEAIQLRDSFREILNKGGEGTLIHPSYGRQLVTVEGPYKITDSDKKLGMFSFEIVFSRSSAAIFPEKQNPTPSTLFQTEQEGREGILQRLEDLWAVPSTLESYTDLSEKVQDFSDKILDAYSSIVEDPTEIINTSKRIYDDASVLVQSGLGVRDSVESIFLALDNIPNESLATLEGIKSLLDFGSDDEDILNFKGASFDQFQRENNRGLYNSVIQSASLLKAYTVSTLVDFRIIENLDDNRRGLSRASESVVGVLRNTAAVFDASSAAGVPVSSTSENDVLDKILDIGAEANTILNEREENLYRVASFNINLSSARLIAYSLFESTEQTPLIADLNNSQKPSALMGNIEALNK